MTPKEIDDIARHKVGFGENGCTMTEAGLYCKLRLLYDAFDSGNLPVDSAKSEKMRLFEEYEAEAAKDKQIAELTEHLDRMINAARDDDRRRVKISSLMIEANKYGCDICRKIAKAYDGRMQQ